VIRRAKESDIPAIVEIENISFPTPWEQQTFVETFESKDKAIIVSETDGKVNGYIILEKVLDEGSITDLAVAPDFRKKGIAQELITTVINIARHEKLLKLFLEVRSNNAQAIRLYEKFGFVRTGRRKGYYSCACPDADLFELNLN
jgi:[ribosomal protein S18]-alanine N-acetyltransferase